MARVAIFDTDGRCTAYYPSAHTPEFDGVDGAVVNPDAPDAPWAEWVLSADGTIAAVPVPVDPRAAKIKALKRRFVGRLVAEGLPPDADADAMLAKLDEIVDEATVGRGVKVALAAFVDAFAINALGGSLTDETP